MNNHIELHVKRIREGFEKIPEMRRNQENAWNPSFKAWRDRVLQSLKTVFREESDYPERFFCLTFWDERGFIGQKSWTSRDQAKFEEDLHQAEELLSDALEELEVAPAAKATEEKTVHSSRPQVIVNVINVLSQTTQVELNQVIASLDDLGLSKSDRESAEKHAEELADEARGQQRWPVLGKSLDALKGLGKSVYERVAIPLLLEMLKKQAGL